jgi:hypothetical protein
VHLAQKWINQEIFRNKHPANYNHTRLVYCTNTIGAASLILLNLFFLNLPNNWAEQKQNTANRRWQRVKKAKDCPAPHSEANTQQ